MWPTFNKVMRVVSSLIGVLMVMMSGVAAHLKPNDRHPGKTQPM